MRLFRFKYKTKVTYGNKGAVLLFTLMVMIVLTSMVGTYLAFVRCSTKSAGAQIVDSQVFYLADAGIHYGIYSLKQSSEWTGTALPVSLGEGTFSVSATDLGGGDYRLTSIGIVDGRSRTVQQDVTLSGGNIPDAFINHAVFFGGGDGTIWTTINNGTTITGDIFINGDMDIGKNSYIDGDVRITGQDLELGKNVTITGDTVTESSFPCDQPSFDTTYYDNEISTAASDPDLEGDQNISGEISGTTYVDGYVFINGDLTGTGTIVCTGDITIKKNITVGDGITLISGDTFTLNNSITIGSNCVLYASEQLTIGNNNIIGSDTTGSALLSDGDIDLGKATIYGLVFGNAQVNTAKITLTGNLSGSEIGNIARNSAITLDSNLVDFSSLEGFGGEAGVSLTLKANTWREQ
jgi:cytoskeletal protein CcmA (bactofilin family)